MTTEHAPTCVLLSGGIDSTACVAFYLRQSATVRGLFIDYGQPAAVMEAAAVRGVSSHYGIECATLVVRGLTVSTPGYVRGRNALLATLALAYSDAVGLVALGLHAGSGYPDCSEPFLDAMQHIVDVYAEGRIRLVAPFLGWGKRDVVAFARQAGVPLDLTYSCEVGTRVPCGECPTCADLEVVGV